MDLSRIAFIVSNWVLLGILLLAVPFIFFLTRKYAQGNKVLKKSSNFICIGYLLYAVILLLLSATGRKNCGILEFCPLVITAIQTCIFAFAIINLADCRIVNNKRLTLVASLVVFITSLYPVCLYNFGNITIREVDEFMLLTTHPTGWYRLLFFLFVIVLNIYLTMLFIEAYKNLIKNDGDLSGNKSPQENIQWLATTFYACMLIDTSAIFSTLVTNEEWWILILIVFSEFYLFFAIRFVDYCRYVAKETLPISQNTEAKEISIESGTRPIRSELEKKVDRWLNKEENFLRGGLTSANMASELCCSRYLLKKCLDTLYHDSFNHIINQKRIEIAKKEIDQDPQLSLLELSLKLGFSDLSVFSRTFKKETGQTPSEYKRNADK